MAKVLVISILLSGNLWAANINKPFNPAHAPHKGSLRLLSFKKLTLLQEDRLNKYLIELRNFLSEQEKKKIPDTIAMQDTTPLEIILKLFIEQSWAQEASNSCFDSSKLSSGQSSYIENAGDHCVIGGFIVCMSLINGRLRCSPNAPDYQKYVTSNCGADESKLVCSYPLFMNKEGTGPLCIAKKPGPVTPQCLSSADRADLKMISAKIKDNKSNIESRYDALKVEIEDYCNHKGKKFIHSFDKGDCSALQNRIDNISKAEPALNVPAQEETVAKKAETSGSQKQIMTGQGCSSKSITPPDGKTLSINLNKSSQGYKIGVEGKDNNWKVGKCNEYYRLIDSDVSIVGRDSQSPQTQTYQTCLYKKYTIGQIQTPEKSDDDGSKSQEVMRIETIAFSDDDSCAIKYSSSTTDSYGTSGTATQCATTMDWEGQNQHKQLYYYSNPTEHAVASIYGATDSISLERDTEEKYYKHYLSGSDKTGYTELFVKQNAGKYECWGRYQKTISAGNSSHQDSQIQPPGQSVK